jgi:hypothetical protein
VLRALAGLVQMKYSDAREREAPLLLAIKVVKLIIAMPKKLGGMQ